MGSNQEGFLLRIPNASVSYKNSSRRNRTIKKETGKDIKQTLNRAMSRWWRREAAIKSVIAEAPYAEKREIMADRDLMTRLDRKLRHSEMLNVLFSLQAPLVEKLSYMVAWAGYAQEVVTLIEKATPAEKEQIANHTAILTDVISTFREDYKQQVIHHLALRAAEIFTNNPNQSQVALTALMVLSHDKLTISKEVNFVAEGTFKNDPAGFERFKNRFIDATTLYLSDKFKLKIESESGQHPGDGEFPILVRLSHNSSANYRLLLYGGTHGEGYVKKLHGRIYELGQKEANETLVPLVYLAHESAHLVLGANDEYSEVWPPLTAIYQDHSLMGHFYREGLEAAEIKKRHYQFLVPLLRRWFPNRIISIV